MGKTLSYNATLVAREDLTDKLTIFRIKPDEVPQSGWFIPGQYCVLGMNNEKDPELGAVRRAMSIASAPSEEGAIEFFIRYVSHPTSDNPLTHLMWDLDAGDRLYMRVHATGKFTESALLEDGDTRKRIFVAAGTGAAPFASMLRQRVLEGAPGGLSNYAILYGASYDEDLGYTEEWGKYVQENGLTFIPSISRPGERPNWNGAKGRVEDFFKEERLDVLEEQLGMEKGGLNADNAVIFICGLTGTVGRCIERLLHRGFVTDNRRVKKALGLESVTPSLFYEQYDTEAPIDLKNEETVQSLQVEWKRWDQNS